MLTNRYINCIPQDSRIKKDGRYLKESALTQEKLAQIRALNRVAEARGQSLAQMALSWLLRNEEVTSVLVGASKPEQIIDNINAINNISFAEDELKKIDEISGF